MVRKLAEQIAVVTGGIPLGRVGDADEVASVAAFPASSDSSFIADTEFFVDGGQAQV